MTKIAVISVVVPDDIKADDVFNHIRSRQWQGELLSFKPNPNDPTTIQVKDCISVHYAAKGNEDAEKKLALIFSALIGLPDVEAVEFHHRVTKTNASTLPSTVSAALSALDLSAASAVVSKP